MIDIAIALVCLFILAATLSAGLVEFVYRLRGQREFNLFKGLVDLLDCETRARRPEASYRREPTPSCQAHDAQWDAEGRAARACARLLLTRYRQTRSLKDKPGRLDPEQFAEIMLDIRPKWPPGVGAQLQRLRRSHPQRSDHRLLAQWFETAMRDHSQAWRSATRRRLCAVGFLLAAVLNLDPSKVIAFAHQQPQVVDRLSADILEEARAEGYTAEEALATLRSEELTDLVLWSSKDLDRWDSGGWLPPFSSEVGLVVLGWLIVALAAALGTPFWIDMLRRLVRRADDVASVARRTLSGDATTAEPPAPASPRPSPDEPPAHWQGASCSLARPFAADFTQRREYWLCFLALEAYSPGPIAARRLADCGVPCLWFADAGSGTQGLVARLGAAVVVAFCGTQLAANDWAIDARAFPIQPHWTPEAFATRDGADRDGLVYAGGRLGAQALGTARHQCAALLGAEERPQRKALTWRRRRSSWVLLADLWQGLRKLVHLDRLDTNIYRDTYALRDPEHEYGVHAGFDEGLIDTLWQTICQSIAELPPADDAPASDAAHSGELYFVGHSLGGALATLAATRWELARRAALPADDAAAIRITDAQRRSLASEELPAGCELAAVVTFGQPQVGTTEFARRYRETLDLDRRHVRYVNGADLVAHLPVPHFTHVGQRAAIGSVHTLCIAQAPGKLVDRLGLNLITDLAGEALGDHALADYLDLLRDPAALGERGLDAILAATTPRAHAG